MLLPLCQDPHRILPIAYHDYHGLVNDISDNESTLADLGQNNVIILRNHGFVACGETIEAASLRCSELVFACETQVKCLGAGLGLDNLVFPSKSAEETFRREATGDGNGVLEVPKGSPLNNVPWEYGSVEWEGWMWKLDYQSNQTGYEYKLKLPYLSL